jgi:hypothetical protein
MKSKDGFVQAYQRPAGCRCAGAGDRGTRCDAKVRPTVVSCWGWPTRWRPTSGGSQGRRRRTQATARRPILRGWRSARSTPMWRPAGPGTPLPARPRRKLHRPGSAQQTKAPTRVEAMRTKIRSGGHASPLPAAQAGGRAGVRDQAGARLPPVPAVGSGQGARRMGVGLHRPQPVEAGSEVESAHRDADAARREACGRLRPRLAAFHAQSCPIRPPTAPPHTKWIGS